MGASKRLHFPVTTTNIFCSSFSLACRGLKYCFQLTPPTLLGCSSSKHNNSDVYKMASLHSKICQQFMTSTRRSRRQWVPYQAKGREGKHQLHDVEVPVIEQKVACVCTSVYTGTCTDLRLRTLSGMPLRSVASKTTCTSPTAPLHSPKFLMPTTTQLHRDAAPPHRSSRYTDVASEQ